MAQSDIEKILNQVRSDVLYFNRINLNGFFKMMKDPSYCYKFYWLEAIVKLILENRRSASYDEIINEMIASAWYTVVEYHVHLSGIWGDGEIKDNLEKAVLKLKKLSQLPNTASEIEIKNKISEFDKELHKEKIALTQNVPYKALSGFADTTKVDLNSSAGHMMSYYNDLSINGEPLPYTFGEEKGLNRIVRFDSSWTNMIKDHAEAILAWVQFEKVRWLQNNNPEVPGLVYKLSPEGEKVRKLEKARKLWNGVMEVSQVRDVFTGEILLKDDYDVDHFIPWSFVMNDELWNLMPMDSVLNSAKSNRLPVWDRYFTAFADNQYNMYTLIYQNAEIRKLYEGCYRDNLHSIWASQELYRKGNSKDDFYSILSKNMRPVYDSARRQGFDIWNYSTISSMTIT